MELVHTWKLFLMTINLPRGRLAPPSAPHTGALALSGATPADREGVGEARMGRNSLRDIHYGHVRDGRSPRQFKCVQGKGSPRRCQARCHGLLKGRAEMVPCRILPASLDTSS